MDELLKLGWTRVKLSDVVENINDYFDRDSGEVARFVAGQHIDEGQLKVRRWGLTSDDDFPPTYNRRFQAGDVLYHSRNLTKLCCPDFAGVTGEKLFILRVALVNHHPSENPGHPVLVAACETSVTPCVSST